MKITGITKRELTHVLGQFERFANTYFWTPPGNASNRRSEEHKNSNTWEFNVDEKLVVCSISIRCSCKNYYSTRAVNVDGGNKKMMIPYLNKLLKEGEFIDDLTAHIHSTSA
jgi:hypothetical protein